MANDRLPLLRGQTVSSPFKAVIGGSRPASPPRPDPAAHRPRLLAQLDAIVGGAQSRPAGQRDPDASREIIAVRPSDPADPLKPEQLTDAKHDVRVVNVDAQSGVVLLDAPGPNLEKLRQKAKEYGQLQHKKREDGTVVTSRKHEAALGPVNEIALATEPDLVGPRLREWVAQGTMPAADIKLWFELACRGGYRNPREWTTKSRDQVCRQVYPITQSIPQQFEAPEELIFFVRLSLNELRRVVASVDCVFTYDVVPRDILTWLTLQAPPHRDIREFSLDAPPRDAPAVVVLDTGIATEHPLLKSAILSATSVVPGMLDAPGDSYGHGTNMAGVALYPDLARALEERRFAASHWLQSVRLVAEPRKGAAAEEDRPYWPSRTESAVATAEQADPTARPRIYALAVTFPTNPLLPTSWAQAVDQLAFNGGRGRLICVAAGNVQPEDLLAASNAYPDSLLQWKIHDPAQGANALTIGAYTDKVRLPPEQAYAEASVVAPAGGAAPHTTTGLAVSPWAIKPDVVMEVSPLQAAP